MSDDDELDIDDFEPWTDDGRQELQAAAEALVAAVGEHARTLVAARGPKDIGTVFEASDSLAKAACRYADAQFELTGTGYPLGAIDAPGQDDEIEDERFPVDAHFVLLHRRDFVVTNEEAVVGAGREVYTRTWEPDDPDEATYEVPDVPAALYELAHADGLDFMTDEVDGLHATVGHYTVVHHDDLLGSDPDTWAGSDLIALVSQDVGTDTP